MSETTRPTEPDPAGKPGAPINDLSPGKSQGSKRRSPGESLAAERPSLTAKQRLLILDSWQRSGLSGPDFSPLVGLSVKTLYSWRGRFEPMTGFSGSRRG